MSLEEYNSIQETLHLTSTTTNRKRLDRAVKNMNANKFIRKALIEK